MGSTSESEQALRAHHVLVPLIERKLNAFVLWFFANKDKLDAQERGDVCPHHEDPDDCPSKNDASHACPFTKSKNAPAAEAQVMAYKTKAEEQLQLLEHSLGPYARGERNVFRKPLCLTTNQTVDSFDELLALYLDEFAVRHGTDPERWSTDSKAQELVQELTAKFLQAVEPDFQVDADRKVRDQ